MLAEVLELKQNQPQRALVGERAQLFIHPWILRGIRLQGGVLAHRAALGVTGDASFICSLSKLRLKVLAHARLENIRDEKTQARGTHVGIGIGLRSGWQKGGREEFM